MNTQQHLAEIASQGFTIIDNAIDPALVEALNQVLLRIESEEKTRPGGHSFGGERKIRIYNLLSKSSVFQEVPVHPVVLPVVEGVLDADCPVSLVSSLSIDAGENAQPVHVDDTL